MNKLLVGILGLVVFWVCDTSLVNAQPSKSNDQKSKQASITFTPLAEQLFAQPTALHLGKGQVSINIDTRSFFFPDLVAEALDNGDTAVNFNTGFSWGISDSLQLTLQFQHVDSSSPVQQGDFTSERTEDNEASLELKQRLWRNSAKTQALSGVFAASWGTRGFMFTQDGESVEINNRDIFVSFAVPFTTSVGNRWQFNISPTAAFFRDESAVFFSRLPDDDESSFGTILGLGGAASYRVNSKLSIFSDVFVPFTGNNSINRDSGEPDRAIAYNAGFRFLTNPRIAIDIFATNTFASFAPLSLTADRDFVGIGANLVLLPELFTANRRIKDNFDNTQTNTEVFTTDGIAFFDGGTIPRGKFSVQLQGGTQGVLTAARYGLLKDFEGGIFLDYVAGEVDESEQGLSGKLRLLNQTENSPFTLSAAGTVSLTNEPFINFFENDADAFANSGLDKTVPIFTTGGDDAESGKRLILTFSLPAQYQISDNTAVWLTPIIGFVQRQSIETGGFNAGGSIALNKEISFTGEIAANFIGEGNALIDGERANAIPWTIGVRWTPLSLFNRSASLDKGDPYLELFVTNRVGSSTWHQLRVRENNSVGVGAGLFFPL